MLADWKKPNIAPRFSSGRAGISDALNTVLPAQLRKAPKNTKMQVSQKIFERYAPTINKTDADNPTASIRNLVLGLNLTTLSKSTQIKDAAVHIAIMYPYLSTEKPFSIQKGSTKDKHPAPRRFIISAAGTKRRRHRSENIVLTAVLESFKIPLTETAFPC